MARRDHLPRTVDLDVYPDVPTPAPAPQPFYGPGAPLPPPLPLLPAYSLMVAGRCVGKTSFLRLLLDTADISHTALLDDIDAVAHFVHAAPARTRLIRSATIELFTDYPPSKRDDRSPIALTLIDTPSLDFSDPHSLDRSVSDIVHFIEGRFADSLGDEQKARNGDHHIHLCLYFLDPDTVVPPLVSSPSVGLNAAYTSVEPACLPALEIRIIRQLSTRVNVLPVIARADTVTTERLAAIKLAIRRDLADAGIGFGIFDVEQPPEHIPTTKARMPDVGGGGAHDIEGRSKASSKSSATTLFSGPISGSSSTATSPPTSPVATSVPKLPHAIISPDVYGVNDGVARAPPPSMHDLQYRYSPSGAHHLRPEEAKWGKFLRSYKWGSIDVLNPAHCDFLPLRNAIFHHLQPLKAYTRDFLFERFRVDVHHHRVLLPPRDSSPPPQAALALPQMHHPPPRPQQLPPISTVAVDLDRSRSLHSPESTSSHPSLLAHPVRRGPPSMPAPFNNPVSNPDSRNYPPIALPSASHQRPLSPAPRVVNSDPNASGSLNIAKKAVDVRRTKNKKITVACNFCRSRKLKCDGGRPACSQCIKRSHPCDYSTQGKRRGNRNQREEDASDGESDNVEDRSYEQDEGERASISDPNDRRAPSQRPSPAREQPPSVSRPESRRSLHVSMLVSQADSPPSPPQVVRFPPPQETQVREREQQPPQSMNGLNGYPTIINVSNGNEPGHANDLRGYMYGVEKPLIAPMPFSGAGTASSSGPSPSGSPPVSIRPSDAPSTQPRKRGGASKAARPTSNYGPKVVACNFCRARKTKCDGVHPSCGSCVRRTLPCNYVNDGPGRRRATAGNQVDREQNGNAHSPGESTGGRSPSMPPSQEYDGQQLPPMKRQFNESEEDSQSFKKFRSERPPSSQDIHPLPPPSYHHQQVSA